MGNWYERCPMCKEGQLQDAADGNIGKPFGYIQLVECKKCGELFRLYYDAYELESISDSEKTWRE